jgi:hypothetical protein
MNIKHIAQLILSIALFSNLIGCTASPAETGSPSPAPTVLPIYNPKTTEPVPTAITETDTLALAPTDSRPTLESDLTPDLHVDVDLEHLNGTISPLVYGVSGGDNSYLQALRPTFQSWGGNPSTRYNWKLGNAWNAGKDWFYMNGNYGNPDGVLVADEFLKAALDRDIITRLAVPTLGWVAKDTSSCSFPQSDGTCGIADGATCQKAGQTADPNTANIVSDPSTIAAWMEHLIEQRILPDYVALDNEPELWGYNHYDVHPECTTYEEILEKHIAYSTAIRAVAPKIKLAGPVACCWFDYWRIAPGPARPAAGVPQDYIAWFLQSVRQHDEASGQRSLDVLDVHFYPQTGVYNENIDPQTAALRLRSTRALWDSTYTDESWIDEPIYFIPRMKDLIDQYYPGTQLGISEWNWGADTSINGALAIAEVLGIFGREGVDYAAYWRIPPLDSPGFFAFKLFTNYDGNGSRFEGQSVRAVSSQPDEVSSYAAYQETTGQLKVILINKNPGQSAAAQINLSNFTPDPSAVLFQYGPVTTEGIQQRELTVQPGQFSIDLPPYSITLLILGKK